MNKKDLIIVSILTLLIASMDISGLPSILFINIDILDITPLYFSLLIEVMQNLILK